MVTVSESRALHARGLSWLGLALCFLLALLVRSLGFEFVLLDGVVIFAPGDAMYHARRALYTFVNFPALLTFDQYINFPGGAPPSWPPLFDFAIGSVARLLVSSEAGFERVAASVGPVLGALTTVPIFLIGRRLAGAGVGLGAAALYALLPAAAQYARFGNPDHHAAVALLGCCLLLATVRPLDAEARVQPAEVGAAGSVGVAAVVGLAAARLAMLLTWHGSLLYLAIAESTLLIGAAVTGRRELFALSCTSASLTLAALIPVVIALPEPLGGDYSSIALSRLHVIAVAVVAGCAGALWLVETRWRLPGPAARLGVLAASGIFALAMLLAVPSTRSGLVPAFEFLTLTDAVGARTGEQFPLFALFGRDPGLPAWSSWGLFAYAIPIAPFALVALWWRDRRPGLLVLAVWCAAFGALALVQRRYGNDLAPSACIAFALLLGWSGRRAGSRYGPIAGVTLTLAVALLLLSPALLGTIAPRAMRSLASLTPGWPGAERARLGVAPSLVEFARRVRHATPETSGFLASDVAPEYGVVAHANLGHALQYIARRPTPTDPFWSYIGQENWDRAFALLSTTSEAEAIELASALRARYLVTIPDLAPESVAARLHAADGSRSVRYPALQHFRLIAEGPRGGLTLNDIFRRRRPRPGSMPYKLYEIVAGAVIDVPVAPGEQVLASLDVQTPTGRRFRYESQTTADSDGRARIRVPYATGPNPYRLDSNDRTWSVQVSEQAIQNGDVIRHPLAPGARHSPRDRVLEAPP